MAVTIELNGADGTKQTHEVAQGGGTDDAQATLCPASVLMSDRCTPEYERILAKMGPGRHSAWRFLFEFFPIGADLSGHETIRRRTVVLAAGNPVMRCLVPKLAEVRRHVALQIAAIAIATLVA